MLDFDGHKQGLLAGRKAFRNQLLFHNKLHEVYTVEVNKLALSRDDKKRVVQSDGVSTLAHGLKDVALDVSEWNKHNQNILPKENS